MRVCILPPGSRGRPRDGRPTRARSSLWSSWSVFVDAWATAQHGCCCSRHLRFGLFTTNCTGDAFCFSEQRNATNSKKTLRWDILRSGVGVWQLPSPKIFLRHIPASVPGSWMVREERGHPELHHSRKSREPRSCGTCHGPSELQVAGR